MITNPAPAPISGGTWAATGGIRSISVFIPNRPIDNDLAGIVILGKVGLNQSLSFPADVFYKGPWAEFITVTTDQNNDLLEANQAYTVGIAAYDEFGTDGIDFGTVTINVVTFQVVTNDISNGAVDSGQIKDGAVTNAKITSLEAGKITAGTITGSTLQTAASGKRFVVSSDSGEARFYNSNGNLQIALGEFLEGGDAYLAEFDATASLNQVGMRVQSNTQGIYVVGDPAIKAYSEDTAIDGEGDIGGYFSGKTYGIEVRGSSGNLTPTAAIFRCTNGWNSSPVVEIYQGGTLSSGDCLRIEVTGAMSTSKAIKTVNGASDLSGGIVYFKSYTVGTLPSASTAGGMIYISNETGGAVMAFSDGTNWRRVTDRAIVS